MDLSKMNKQAFNAVDSAVQMALARGNIYVTEWHLLLTLICAGGFASASYARQQKWADSLTDYANSKVDSTNTEQLRYWPVPSAGLEETLNRANGTVGAMPGHRFIGTVELLHVLSVSDSDAMQQARSVSGFRVAVNSPVGEISAAWRDNSGEENEIFGPQLVELNREDFNLLDDVCGPFRPLGLNDLESLLPSARRAREAILVSLAERLHCPPDMTQIVLAAQRYAGFKPRDLNTT